MIEKKEAILPASRPVIRLDFFFLVPLKFFYQIH
jgi:hypothetical protein